MKKVTRLDPDLWESCKKEAVTKMGKFSARAMQHAVMLYKKRGGKYDGTKTSGNSLVIWAKENANKAKKDLR